MINQLTIICNLILKQVAENEVQYINDSLRSEKARNLKLEKELKDFKSCCSCRKEVPSEASAGKPESTSESRVNDLPLLEVFGSTVHDVFRGGVWIYYL